MYPKGKTEVFHGGVWYRKGVVNTHLSDKDRIWLILVCPKYLYRLPLLLTMFGRFADLVKDETALGHITDLVFGYINVCMAELGNIVPKILGGK